MIPMHRLAQALIAEAEATEGIHAGIAGLDAVLDGPSYRAAAQGSWRSDHSEKKTTWLPNGRSLLVLAMRHPEAEPRLDWFDRGNTAGNRRMAEISEALSAWLLRTHGLPAQPLPYHVERGGVYLKDAAVLAGLGVIGKNNLLLHRRWGPRIRLRAVLIAGSLPSGGPIADFHPCRGCDAPCREACPENAFGGGKYHRPPCIRRLESDRAHPIDSGETDAEGHPIRVTDWCRRCEFACPVGRG